MVDSNLSAVMKQAQKMQEHTQKVQEEIANMKVIGVAGGDMVKIYMNGKHNVTSVDIDPVLFAEDRDMLEDMIAAAINDANHRINNITEEKISSMTGAMGLPAGMKFPF